MMDAKTYCCNCFTIYIKQTLFCTPKTYTLMYTSCISIKLETNFKELKKKDTQI